MRSIEFPVQEHARRRARRVKPAPIVTFGGGLEYQRPVVGPGPKQPTSVDRRDLFDDTSAPGLFGAAQLSSDERVSRIRLPATEERAAGRLVPARRQPLCGAASDTFTFNRFDADLRQYASILAERRVLAVRLFVSTSDPASGARVPFYLMPTLGGHDSLRGFRDYRFRGPHAILTQTQSTAGRSGRVSTRRCFTTQARSRSAAPTSTSRDLEEPMASAFDSTPTTARSSVSTRGSAASDGNHLYIVFGDVF